MKYTEYAIKDGTKLRCTKSGTYNRWVEGDIYTVENEGIFDSDGNHIGNYYILYCLNEQDSNVKFEIVKEEEKVEYTEKDLKAGMKLRCTKATPTHWTVGKVYEPKRDRVHEQAVNLNAKARRLEESLELLREYM